MGGTSTPVDPATGSTITAASCRKAPNWKRSLTGTRARGHSWTCPPSIIPMHTFGWGGRTSRHRPTTTDRIIYLCSASVQSSLYYGNPWHGKTWRCTHSTTRAIDKARWSTGSTEKASSSLGVPRAGPSNPSGTSPCSQGIYCTFRPFGSTVLLRNRSVSA